MQIRELIQQVRSELQNTVTRGLEFDAYEIMDRAEIVLRGLAKEDWSFLTQHINPAIKTHTGVRNYPLPDNFGDNFVRGSDDGSRFVCKLSDGTGEQHLNYQSPAQFFDADFEGASNGVPADYTVQSDAAFYKEIWLDPPPDSNSSTHYTVRGLYKPTFVNLNLDSFVPEEISSYLLFGVLMRLDKENPLFIRDFTIAKDALVLEEARLRQTRLVAQQGELPGHDGWVPEFQ